MKNAFYCENLLKTNQKTLFLEKIIKWWAKPIFLKILDIQSQNISFNNNNFWQGSYNGKKVVFSKNFCKKDWYFGPFI